MSITMMTQEVQAAVKFLDAAFDSSRMNNVSFRLWDGTLWPDDSPRAATIVLKHPGALRDMFGSGTEKKLAEAFLHDDFDVSGDIEAACEMADMLAENKGSGWLALAKSYFHLRHLPGTPKQSSVAHSFSGTSGRQHSRDRDRQAVSFHYDVSNEFFGLWLDRHMLYSCAYFEKPDNDIDTAQTAKLDYLCQKLRLRPGQKVLDIGCGWGGFARYAARTRGVNVTGITLSQQQARLGIERVQKDGLSERVQIELRDYRELEGSEAYDAIVSVGMSEHVGAENLPRYFQIAARLLKPGGVFLNHAIGEGARTRSDRGPSFLKTYVFPDTEIPPIPVVLRSAESAGLEVRDVENLREHYALTLRQWTHRLEANHDKALSLVDEATYRVWRLYMAGSAHGFAKGELAIYQALLSKPDASGRSHLPLTRRDWYK